MKLSQLRKAIREEIKKSLNENYRDPKENVAILHGMLNKGGRDAKRAKDIIKDIKDELSVIMSTTDPKANLKLVTKLPELDEYLDDAIEDALDNGMGRFKGMSGSMAGMREVTALPTDMEKIEDFIMSSPQFETMSTSKIKTAARDMFDEWKAVAKNYRSIEAYFEEVEENGGEESFMENTLTEDAALVGQIALGVAGGLAGLWMLIKGGSVVRNVLGAVTYELGKKLERKAKEAVTDRNKAIAVDIIKKFEGDDKLAGMYKTLPAYSSSNTQKANTINKERTKQLKAIAEYIKTKLTPEEMKYFNDVSAMLRTGSVQTENKMNKTSKMVKRLKEDTAYQEFFKKAMAKFNISALSDLKDADKKKEFFNYIEMNYRGKDEMNEGTYLMSKPDVKSKVEMIISTLKDIDIDGETMEYILDEVGMSDQMASQLGDKVDDDGFPSMDGGRP